jgi:DNA-binding HxlR family transcriptional regulator
MATTARTYGEACGIPRALDRIGERWALMVVRELVLGPKRFTDLRTGLPAASPNVLSQRLRELEAHGVVHKRKLPPPAASTVYELTEWGRQLEPVLQALGRWGARAPLLPGEPMMSFDAHILSFRTLFDPSLAGDFDTSLELRFGEDVFHARVHEGTLDMGRGAPAHADAVVESEVGMLLGISHGRNDLYEALRLEEVRITGDIDSVRQFLRLFTLPAPALEAA